MANNKVSPPFKGFFECERESVEEIKNKNRYVAINDS
jgi:hypothetical protein